MNETTFIIGNGFDLDLGLKTSYLDFANSEYWSIDSSMLFSSELARTLDNAKKDNPSWFDIERLLAEYAVLRESVIFDALGKYFNDKHCFSVLQDSLGKYIASEEKKVIRENSLAAQLLKLMTQYSIENVFSYNYTNLNLFTTSLHLPQVRYQHVHGKCDDSTQILGISDETKIRPNYDFLYKTCSPNYCSSNVRYALQRSSFVLFFGHSLGSQDYHYFANFFREQSRMDIKESDKKTIYVVTYDDVSRMQIIKQLRTMNEGRMNLLYDCNDFHIFTSKNAPQTEILLAIENKLR